MRGCGDMRRQSWRLAPSWPGTIAMSHRTGRHHQIGMHCNYAKDAPHIGHSNAHIGIAMACCQQELFSVKVGRPPSCLCAAATSPTRGSPYTMDGMGKCLIGNNKRHGLHNVCVYLPAGIMTLRVRDVRGKGAVRRDMTLDACCVVCKIHTECIVMVEKMRRAMDNPTQ